MARYLRPTLEHPLRMAARDFPAVVLTGPRQSGKTVVHPGSVQLPLGPDALALPFDRL